VVNGGKLRLWAYVTSLLGNLHFAVGAGLGSIYGSYDMRYMLAQYWPLRIAQHDDRDCVNLQILLVPDILSGVINTSNPASSAALSNSPFLSLSHPR